ncbi:MAG: hypothetical protein A3K22_02160 [Deltaproteobacteria bacterium RBG_16_42_7]|nr:MAG: hypothetical protein A3K22_02160 [Deltaproteobacteria bacterium RBG_16_42_7]
MNELTFVWKIRLRLQAEGNMLRAEREAKGKEERERQEAIEAEERKAQMTDKEKLGELTDNIEAVIIPEMKSKKAKATAIRVKQLLVEIIDLIEEEK